MKCLKLNFVFLIIYFFHLGCSEVTPNIRAEFKVTITNLSKDEKATLLSEGVFYLHQDGFPLFFTSSLDYGKGLELLAEEGIPDTLLPNLKKDQYVSIAGNFPPIESGKSITFNFVAQYGDFLNFATMFTDSNDGFYSFDEEGILLFLPGGEPINGDFTKKVWLWDAGTEANNEPYIGRGQPERDGEGSSTMEPVRLLNDEFIDQYPNLNEVIKITIVSNPI